MLYALIGCLVIIGFLGIKLYQKQKIDKREFDEYTAQLKQLQNQVNIKLNEFNGVSKDLVEANNKLVDTKEKTEYELYKLGECRKDLQAALDVYQDITDNKLKEIDASMEEQRQKRQEELDSTFNESKEKLELKLKSIQHETEQQIGTLYHDLEVHADAAKAEELKITFELEECREKYNSLLEPIKQYEKEKQERLFYTIQLPEEYQEDIEFLLTTVASKVQHPDIISKLVWAEYVKPNLDETFKRIEIKAEPGIYKITNINTNKAYIGKSTNVKTRIADHFKSSIGITSIANQAVHHAIRKEGFWNWAIEVITYTDKDKLSELEKYYIDFFKTQEFGYNKNSGG